MCSSLFHIVVCIVSAYWALNFVKVVSKSLKLINTQNTDHEIATLLTFVKARKWVKKRMFVVIGNILSVHLIVYSIQTVVSIHSSCSKEGSEDEKVPIARPPPGGQKKTSQQPEM